MAVPRSDVGEPTAAASCCNVDGDVVAIDEADPLPGHKQPETRRRTGLSTSDTHKRHAVFQWPLRCVVKRTPSYARSGTAR